MGGLWSRLFVTNYEYRILMQGLDAAGKTTVLYRLKLGELVQTIPTIGFNVETVKFKNISLTAWDIGGRDKIRPLLRHYYPNTDAVIMIVDSHDRERMDQARDELRDVFEAEEIRDCPVVVMANKQDLSPVMTTDEIAKALDLHSAKQTWAIFPTSATKGEGLTDAIDWLISQLGHHAVKSSLAKPVAETVGDLNTTIAQSKGFFKTPYEIIKKWFSPT